MFEAKTYIERRKILKEELGSGIVLFFGNGESPMNYADNTYHFRQDSSFLYYFGIQKSDLMATINIDDDQEVIYGDEFTIEDIVWRGAQMTIKEMAANCGITNVKPMAELDLIIRKAKSLDRPIHFLPLYRPENKIKLMDLVGLNPNEIGEKFSIELVKAVINQREIKTADEIIELHNAVDISVDMHVAAIRIARPGMTEAQIAAEIQKVAKAAGGNIAFPIIATINGQTLHNHYHGNVLKEGDLLLVDAGFENAMCYSGDLSSTIPVSLQFTTRQKEIYQIALRAHEAAIDTLAIDVPFLDVHMSACRSIFDGLKEMGFTKGNTEDALVQGVHALFFPCGTGHMMGLDVHDMEDLGEQYVGYDGSVKSKQFGLKSLRLAKPLQEGHVLTIEPGIYFIQELIDSWRAQSKFSDYVNWDRVDAYRNFGGIRNEEDFVMTKDGAQLLGKPKPKTIDEIEALRNY